MWLETELPVAQVVTPRATGTLAGWQTPDRVVRSLLIVTFVQEST